MKHSNCRTQVRSRATSPTPASAQTPHKLALTLILLWAAHPNALAQTPFTPQPPHVLAPVEVQGDRLERDEYASNVSTVGKIPLSPREIPQSISTITSQRIRDQSLTTVDDAMKQVTGVTVIANDSSQSQYYSRGYSMGVAYDGIPLRCAAVRSCHVRTHRARSSVVRLACSWGRANRAAWSTWCASAPCPHSRCPAR